MRILLVAYEFPPSPSPQSLRWAYLSRELALRGHEVHVLTIDLGGASVGLPDLPGGVRVHRTHAGLFRGLVAWRRNRRMRARASRLPAAPTAPPARASRGGLKHRVSRILQALAERLWYPDLRGEWRAIALRALPDVLRHFRPDVVIASHEPATSLEVGLAARAAGHPLVADLGDPVLAPYTPRHWRRRAHALESSVCAGADHVLVTTPDAAALLATRHGRHAGVTVLTQGYDAAPAPADEGIVDFDPGTLELLYTGSFYAFRTAGALVAAVEAVDGVRLNVASIALPDVLRDACRRDPSRFRALGFLPHREALAAQRRADVLVSIANDDAAQVPGKFYEYLGANRPVLHLAPHVDNDAAAARLAALGRGVTCAQTPSAIVPRLQSLLSAKRSGTLDHGFALGADDVAAHAWQSIAARLETVLREVASHESRG
ncbi:hypothetical protein GCM10028862_10880 [Luteimonas pelagia]